MYILDGNIWYCLKYLLQLKLKLIIFSLLHPVSDNALLLHLVAKKKKKKLLNKYLLVSILYNNLLPTRFMRRYHHMRQWCFEVQIAHKSLNNKCVIFFIDLLSGIVNILLPHVSRAHITNKYWHNVPVIQPTFVRSFELPQNSLSLSTLECHHTFSNRI